jgi:hypothetical protein
LDIVLIIEVLAPEAVRALRAFIADGQYEIRQRTEGSPVLYRFAKPKKEQFPFMLEFFSRKPEGINLAECQEIVPLPAMAGPHSLSAILLDDDYYYIVSLKHLQNEGGLLCCGEHGWKVQTPGTGPHG